MNNELKENLNKLIASLMVLYMKLHHFHWFIAGPHSLTLHEKFEELYDEVTEHIDVVAERLLQLKEQPISTLKECLEQSLLKEAASVQGEKECGRAATRFNNIKPSPLRRNEACPRKWG